MLNKRNDICANLKVRTFEAPAHVFSPKIGRIGKAKTNKKEIGKTWTGDKILGGYWDLTK